MKSTRSGSVGGKLTPQSDSTSPASKRDGTVPASYHDAATTHKFNARLNCTVRVGSSIWTAEGDAVKARYPASGELHTAVNVFDKMGVIIHSLVLVSETHVWCGLDDGYIVILDVATEKFVSDFRQHSGAVLALVQEDAREKSVYSGGSDWKIYEWSSDCDEEGRVVLQRMFYSHSNSVRCLAISSSGFLISGSSDCSVRLWRLGGSDSSVKADQGECYARLESHKGAVRSVAIQDIEDDVLVWSSDEQGCICLWGIEEVVRQKELTKAQVKARPLRQVHQHKGAIPALMNYKNEVWSCGQDGHVLCWGVEWQGGASPPDVWVVRCLSAHKERLIGMQLCGMYTVQKVWTFALDYQSRSDGTVVAWNIEVSQGSEDVPSSGGYLELDRQMQSINSDTTKKRINELLEEKTSLGYEVTSLKEQVAQLKKSPRAKEPVGQIEGMNRLREENEELRSKVEAGAGALEENSRLQRENKDLQEKVRSVEHSKKRQNELLTSKEEEVLKLRESGGEELRKENEELRIVIGTLKEKEAMMPEVLERLEELRRENENLQRNARELITQKTKTCDLLRLDVARLSNELSSCEGDKRVASSSMYTDTTHRRHEVDELELELRSLRDKLRRRDDEATRFEKIHLQNEEGHKALRDELERLKLELKTKGTLSREQCDWDAERDEMAVIKELDVKHGATINALEASLADLTRENEQLKVRHTSQSRVSNSKYQVMEKHISDLRAANDEKKLEIDRLNDALSRCYESAQGDDKLRLMLDDSNKAAAQLQKTVTQQDMRIQSLHETIEEQRRELVDYQETALNQSVTVENMKADCKNLNMMLENSRSEADNQMKVVDSLKEILNERNKSMDLLREVVQERTQQIDALEEDLRVMQVRGGDITEDMSRSKIDSYSERASLHDRNERLERTRDELEAKRRQVDRLQAEIDELYTEKDAMEQKVAEANAKDLQIIELESQIEEYSVQLEQAQVDVDRGMSALEECSQLRKALLDKEADMEKLVVALDTNPQAVEARERVVELEEENAVLLSDNKTLAEQQELLQTHLTELEAAAAEAKELAEVGEEYNVLLEKHQEVKDLLQEEQGKCATLYEKASAPKLEVQELQAKISELDLTLTAREEAARHAQANRECMQRLLDEHEHDTKVLRAGLEEYKKHIDTLTIGSDVVDKLMKENRNKAGTIASLQVKVSTLTKELSLRDVRLKHSATQASELNVRLATLEKQLSGGQRDYVDQLVILHQQKNSILAQLMEELECREGTLFSVQDMLSHKPRTVEPIDLERQPSDSHVEPPSQPQPPDPALQGNGVVEAMMAEIMSLRSEARALRMRQRELASSLRNADAEKDALRNRLAELGEVRECYTVNHKIEEKNTELQDLADELNNCEHILSQREALVETLQLKLVTVPPSENEKEHIECLEADIDELQVSISKVNSENLMYKNQLAAITERIVKLESQVDSKGKTIDLLRQLLEERNKAVQLLRQELELEADTSPSRSLQQMLDAHTVSLKTLEQHTGRDLKGLEWSVRDLEETVREKELVILDLQKTRQLNSQEIADLKTEFLQATRDLEGELKKRREQEHDMIRLTGTINAAHKNIDELRVQLDEREDDLRIAERTTQRIEELARQNGIEDVDSIKHELRAKDKQLRVMEKETEECNKLLQGQQAAVTELKQVIKDMKAAEAELHEQLEARAAEVADLQDLQQESVERIDSLTAEFSETAAQRDDHQQALRDLEKKAMWEELNRVELTNTSELAKQALDEKVGTIDLLKDTVEELQERLDESDLIVKQKDATSSRHQQSYIELQRMYHTLQADLKRREAIIKDLEEELAQADEKVTLLDTHKQKLEEELTRQLQNVRSFEEVNEELRSRLREGSTGGGYSSQEPATEGLSVVRKMSEALQQEQQRSDELSEERDSLLARVIEKDAEIEVLQRDMASQKRIEALSVRSVSDEGERERTAILQNRVRDLEATKEDILNERDALDREVKELRREAEENAEEEGDVKVVLKRAVQKHHAFVPPNPSLLAMARSLVSAAAADSKVADLLEPLKSLAAVLGIETEVDFAEPASVIDKSTEAVGELLQEVEDVRDSLEKAQDNLLKEKEKRKLMVDDVQQTKMLAEQLAKGYKEIRAGSDHKLDEATDRAMSVSGAYPKLGDVMSKIAALITDAQGHIGAVVAAALGENVAYEKPTKPPQTPPTKKKRGSNAKRGSHQRSSLHKGTL